MGSAGRTLCFATIACLLSAWPARAPALDPSLDVSQYGQTTWKIREGFGRAPIISMAQTPDGYLWLGTLSGLMRFDGVRLTAWGGPQGAELRNSSIYALFVARDGRLWIGSSAGLASWNGRALVNNPRFDRRAVNSFAQDSEGTIWASASWLPARGQTAMLCALRRSKTECFGENGTFGPYITLASGDHGSIWAGSHNGLWRWKPAPAKFFPMPDAVVRLAQDKDGTDGVTVVTQHFKVFDVQNETVWPLPAWSAIMNAQASDVLADHDGVRWFGTLDGGLFHFRQGRTDHIGRSDGLSGDRITSLFEDRERNVWVATTDGLDRFRPLSATTYSASQGLSGWPGSVLADRDGKIWINTTTGHYTLSGGSTAHRIDLPGLPPRAWASLYQDRRGRIWFGSTAGLGYIQNERFSLVPGVPPGYIDSIVGTQNGDLLVAHRTEGLLRVSPEMSVQHLHWAGGDKWGKPWRLAVDPVNDGFWVGYVSGGVVHVVDGRIVAAYSASDGLGSGRVNDLRLTVDGAVWTATDHGLNRIKASHIATLDKRNGLPCDAVSSSIQDGEGSTWLYTECGLIRISRTDLDAWAAGVDRGKVPATIHPIVLDDSDGVRSVDTNNSSVTPHITKAPDGKLWFVAYDGVTVVDPRHLATNPIPPPVHIEQVIADRKTYDASAPIRLPPLLRDLQIDYTALSFVAPEKVRFLYKLEGRDRAWQDPGNRRQAFYTDLAPGNYRFHVIAANNSGVWNREGATLEFSIAPAFWQTRWFLALIAAALLLSFGAIYQMRVMQLKRRAALARESDERQREMLAQLARANRLATMGQLAASIAHEVKNPIAAAVTNAQAAQRWLAAQPPNLEEVRDALSGVANAGRSASDVIDRIRAFVKNEPPKKEPLDINEKVGSVLVLTRSEAEKNRVAVMTELGTDLPPVEGDPVQVQQVLLNLIMNAIEAMSSIHGAPRELLILSENAKPGFVAVEVRDSGPGLPPEGLDALFDAFYTTKPTGLGMGLSISRSIIEAHGGKLTVAANVPRGAIFRFTMPVSSQAVP
jgi:signal transduction histidine kinase/ligand-binding sensor domain-containing protein